MHSGQAEPAKNNRHLGTGKLPTIRLKKELAYVVAEAGPGEQPPFGPGRKLLASGAYGESFHLKRRAQRYGQGLWRSENSNNQIDETLRLWEGRGIKGAAGHDDVCR